MSMEQERTAAGSGIPPEAMEILERWQLGSLPTSAWGTGFTYFTVSIRDRADIAPLVETVDARFAAKVGHAYDVGKGTLEDVVNWLAELDALRSEVRRHIDHALDRLEWWNEQQSREISEYEREWRAGGIVDAVAGHLSEAAGGVDFYELDLPDVAGHIASGRGHAEWWMLAEAAADVNAARDACEQRTQAWAEFRGAAGEGAAAIATGLEVTRDVSFAVAVSLATGGLASAVGITSGAAKVALGAHLALYGAVAQQTATDLGEHLAGTDDAFVLTDTLKVSVKSYYATALGGAVSSWAQKAATGAGTWIGKALLERGCSKAVSDWGAKWAATAIEQAADAGVQAIFTVTVDLVASDTTYASKDAFFDDVLRTFCDNFVNNMAGEMAGDLKGAEVTEQQVAAAVTTKLSWLGGR